MSWLPVGMVFLTELLPLVSSASEVVISYVSADVGDSCLSVCSAVGLECYDNFLQDMSCEAAAQEVCSNNDIDDTSGNYHCDKGGCYVSCSHEVYASRGTQYWTCNTQPICHTAVGSSDNTYYGYDQVCACAYLKDVSNFHIYVWQIVGICLFFACCALGTVQIIAIIFPNLFPSKETYQKMGVSDTSATWSEKTTQVLIKLKSTGDSFKKFFGKTTVSDVDSSTHSAEGSSDGERDDIEQKARKERKEKRAAKKKKGSHTALSLSDMDYQ